MVGEGRGGVWKVPMEPFARDAILAYIRIERPDYHGRPDEEPLFLTAAYAASGWHSMAQRLRRWCAEDGIAFKQHRLRPTRTRLLHEAGWEDSAIMEALGWKSVAMLRRYLGKIPVSRLKTYPMTLGRVFGPAAQPNGSRLPLHAFSVGPRARTPEKAFCAESRT